MHLPNHCFKRENKPHLLLNPDNISIKEELIKIKNLIQKLKILDVDDNITDDVVSINDELIKTEDYIKRDKIKNT